MSNLRLYPPASPMIDSSNDKAFAILQDIIETEGAVTVARSKTGLIVSGQALAGEDPETPQVAVFGQRMVDLQIKNITFEKGLDKAELRAFLESVSRTPATAADQGTLDPAMADAGSRHILLDGGRAAAVVEDQPVAPTDQATDLDEADDSTTESTDADTGSDIDGSDIDVEAFREGIKEPGWVAKVLGYSIERIAGQQEAAPVKEVSEAVVHIIDTLSEVADDNTREEVLTQIVSAISGMDEEALSMVLAQDPGGDLSEDLFAAVVDQLDSSKLEGLSARFEQMEEDAVPGKNGLGRTEAERRSGKDRRSAHSLAYLLKGHLDRRTREDQRKSRVLHVKAGLNSILKGEEDAFLDRQVMLAVPTTVEQLFAAGKRKTAENIIDRLGDGLHHDQAEVRAETSAVLAHINYNFAAKNRMEEMLGLARRLIGWIRFETSMSSSYKDICGQLRAMGEALIRRRRFSDCSELLETLHLIRSGETAKSDEIRAVSGDVLEAMAKEDIVDLLLHEAASDENGFGEQAAGILDMLGPERTVATQGGQTEPAMDELARQMWLVDSHVRLKGTGSAAKVLLDLVARYAKDRDFAQAELLREKLLEVDPTAETEITASSDILENEKRKVIDQDHLTLWKKIYDSLSVKEGNAVYYATKSDRCNAGQTIYSQGEIGSRLLFIEEGRIKLVFHQQGEELLIREANPGEVVGEDSFFHASVRTTSAVALTPVRFRSLERDSLAEWKVAFPELASKLADHCLGLETNAEILKRNGADRRSHERTNVQESIEVRALDDSGAPSGEVIVGTLSDISEGGLSFYVGLPKESAEGLLLAPKLSMRFALTAGGSQRQMDLTGTAVAVRLHVDIYYIGVKFDKTLDARIIEEIGMPESPDDELLGIGEPTD